MEMVSTVEVLDLGQQMSTAVAAAIAVGDGGDVSGPMPSAAVQEPDGLHRKEPQTIARRPDGLWIAVASKTGIWMYLYVGEDVAIEDGQPASIADTWPVIYKPRPRPKTCWRCGRSGKKQFIESAAGEAVSRWKCSNADACRSRIPMPEEEKVASQIANLNRANERRAEAAGQRRTTQAREALALIEGDNPNVHLPSRVSRDQWIEALRLRISDENASLRELASAMSTPMTKDQYAAILRRACQLAASAGQPSQESPGVTRKPLRNNKLASLIESASRLHGRASDRTLARIAQQSGYEISSSTLSSLRHRPVKPRAARGGIRKGAIRAVAFLAQVPESVVREAAAVRGPDEVKQSLAAYQRRYQRDYQKKGQNRTLSGASNRRQPWTRGEDQIILAYMRDPAARINDLARELGRSRAGLTNRLQELRSKSMEPAVHSATCTNSQSAQGK